MAFSSTKTQQDSRKPNKEARLPLIGAMSNRNQFGNKDQRFINIYPETRKVEAIDSTRIFLNKRPGLTQYKTLGVGAGVCQGIIYFRSIIYSCFAGKLYADATLVATLGTTTGPIGMIVGNSSTLGDYLFICDGTSGWVVNSSGTCTKITDTDFPSPHNPVPTFIDGYILLSKGSDVYNCVLDTPSSWNSGEYLSAEMFPDPIVALGRQNNQVVVFGSESVEFFYDAANTTGSPLSRNESTTLQMGCACPYAIYQNERTFIFVAQSQSGGRAIWQVDGFQPKKVSDEYIDRIIDKESNPLNVRGFGFRTLGHLFYLVNLPTLNRTLVYDTEEKLWHEWSTNSSGSHSVFEYNYMVDIEDGYAYLQQNNTGTIARLDTANPTDMTTTILTEIVTNKYDMDTYKRKFMTNFRVVGDSYLIDNEIKVRWSDDDYRTWSNYKTISLSDDFPNFSRLGSYRRRAFNLLHDKDLPLRLECIEVDFYIGES